MAPPMLELFNREQLDKIHEASMEILSKIGILIESEEMLQLVAEHVPDVDMKSGRARIDESTLMEWVKKAPGEITLCGRDPKNDLPHPAKRPGYGCPDGQPAEVFDLDSGRRRYSTKKDCVELAKLADALPEIGLYWPMVSATDMPGEICSYYELVASLDNTTKHIQHGANGHEEAAFQIEYASAIAGSPEELRRRPILSNTHTPISPLVLDKNQIEGAVALSRAGIPNIHLTMVIQGSTGPVTVAGSLAQANAEILASIAVCQMAAPGCPSIYSCESGAMDMRSGVFMSGSIEGALITAGACQLSHMYGLPNQMGGLAASGAVPGYEVGFQKAMSGLIPAMAGADAVVGIGGLNRSGVESAVQMVIDCELWRFIERGVREISVDADALAIDVIEQVGPGKTYLTNKHTLRHFKQEIAMPGLASGRSMENIDCEEEMIVNAKERAKKIIAEHESPEFPSDLKKELDEIYKRHSEMKMKSRRS
ncbi:MAG TPA: hypothetical protein ENN25_02395 [Euryarchaeota archaeon]|nr:hypothetical protein [Euryarchaeota archaeon]